VARAAEVAPGELHSPGSHNEVFRAYRRAAGDGTTSKRAGSPLPEPITEFNPTFGTREVKPVSRLLGVPLSSSGARSGRRQT
jgi:hypothetical protein